MFRGIKFNSKDEFKAILYKNCREQECEIPSKYIDTIDYKLRDCNTLEMTIPDKETQNGSTINNPLFEKIKGKKSIIINNTERYIISSLKIEGDKNINKKRVIAKSFEYDLNKKNITVPAGTFQLYKDKNDKIDVENGVLNWLEDETSWKIGYVDPYAKNVIGLFDEEKEIKLYEPLTVNNVQVNTILIDKDINIDIGNQALNFSIKYNNIKSTDNKTNTHKTENYSHDFEKFAQPIKHIKVIYTLDSSYNTVLKYEFTLKDGFIKKDTKPFTYLQGFDVEFQSIYITYKTGEKIEKEKVKYRTFDKNTHQWLSFLREVVESAFDCIFQFDTINKIINVYDRESFGEDNGFYLYYDQYLMKFDKDLKIDDVITRLIVEGKDGLSINDVNPLGTNYVEDFTYLLRQGNISEELQRALVRYETLTKNVLIEWKKLKSEKDEKSKQSVYLDAQLQEIKEKLNVQNAIRVAYIKSGEDRSDLQKEEYENVEKNVSELNLQFNNLMKILTNLKEEIKELDIKIINYNNLIKKRNATDDKGLIFTKEDLNELDECIYSERQQDDYYTDSQELYNNSKRVLAEKNQLPITFTTDVYGITKHPRGWRNVLKLGDIGHIMIDNNKEVSVKISGFKYLPPRANIPAKVTNIEFKNNRILHDLKTIRNVSVRQINFAKSAISFWKNTWIDSSMNNKLFNKIQNNGIDTSLVPISSKSNINDIDITGSGVWCTDKTDNTLNKQMYFGSGFMAVTNNNWNTCRTIADEKGLVAKSIFGTAIIGDRMNMSNLENTFLIDENGVSVKNKEGKLKARLGFYESNGETKFSFILYNKTGDRVLLSEDGMAQIINISREDNLNDKIPLYIPLNISKDIKEIREVKLFLHLEKYRSSVSDITDKYSFSETERININVYDGQIDKIKPTYNLKETTMAKNVVVKLNGEIIAEKINEDVEINITKEKINKNKNTIEVFSETNGRVNALLTLNAFVSV